MPLPGDSAGRGRRPQWPLTAAWAASVAGLLVITPPPRAVLLVGGPWEGRMLLARAGPMPEEIQLAGPETPPCSYRRRAGDRARPQLCVLRHEPDDGTGAVAGL